nr:hypothetical protein [Atrato Sobemo-like virus 3]
MLTGSEIYSGSLENVPKCQVRIMSFDGNTATPIGAGIRIGDFLVTPYHNITVPGVTLVGRKLEKTVKVISECVHEIAADAVAIELSADQWATLEVQSATIGLLGRGSDVAVHSGCDFTWSTGRLAPVDEMIGRVKYGASTAMGFSGSAYISGKMVLGMHVHGRANSGGGFNGGYEAMYLWVLIKHLRVMLDKPFQEAGPSMGSDAQFEVMRDIDFSYQDLGEVKPGGSRMGVGRIKGSGKYIYAQYDAFERKKELQTMRDAGKLKAWTDIMELDELEDECASPGVPEAAVGPTGVSYPGEGRGSQAGAAGGQEMRPAPKASQSTIESDPSMCIRRAKAMKVLEGLSTKRLHHLAFFNSGKGQK